MVQQQWEKGKNIFQTFKNYLKWFFDISDGLEEKESVINNIKEGVSFRGTNILILILAMFIASLGLNVNSTAVIIGAMLISPLMGPIIGMGLGLGIHDMPLIKRSFRNLAMAALFSIIASTLYFLITPLSEERSELLARTSPTIYDVLIAFFGGCAGILALSSKQKGNVLPGVAIATALMPPLCTAGYGLATLQFNYFLGAFYLFLINSIFIGAATALGVHFFRFPRVRIDDNKRSSYVTRIVYAITIITIIPSIFLTYMMLKENYFVNNANKFVDREFVFPNTQVLKRSADIVDGKKIIKVSLVGESISVDSLKVALYDKMADADLEGATLEISQGFSSGNLDVNKLSSQVFSDLYKSNQRKMELQAVKIDSLQRQLDNDRRFTQLTQSIVSEMRILFPEVDAFSLNRSFFARQDGSMKVDTMNMAIVTLHRDLSKAQEDKMLKYLEARSGLKDIRLIRYRSELKFRCDSVEN